MLKSVTLFVYGVTIKRNKEGSNLGFKNDFIIEKYLKIFEGELLLEF